MSHALKSFNVNVPLMHDGTIRFVKKKTIIVVFYNRFDTNFSLMIHTTFNLAGLMCRDYTEKTILPFPFTLNGI